MASREAKARTPTSATGSNQAIDLHPEVLSVADLEQVLVELHLVDAALIERVRGLKHRPANPADLGKMLMDMGVVSETNLFQAYARLVGLPLWDGDGEFAPTPPLDRRDFLFFNRLLPIRINGNLAVVLDEVFDDGLIDLVKRLLPDATIALLPTSELTRLLNRHLESTDEERADEESEGHPRLDAEHLKDLALEAPIIRWVNDVITDAVRRQASDIHLEPSRHRVALRLRIDGVLYEQPPPNADELQAVISRIKILGNMDIAERRLPQDGRIRSRAEGREVDIRVSTVPTPFGEDVVMRLLDRKKQLRTLEHCGISRFTVDNLRACLTRSHGMILVTGPTGSGKTTTLYAALQETVDGRRKVITVEDPVEYEIPGITQIPVKEEIGMGFAAALRSILRHDPDIILVGEIRDRETAASAVQASLTGHLVLSTLHTNSAVGAISRLLDMGIQDYLLASSLTAVCAQRLVRMLCPECKRPTQPNQALLQRHGLPVTGENFFEPAGCYRCSQTGFRGRTAISEFILMDATLREVVLNHPTQDALETASRRSLHYRGLLEDGMEKVSQGMTTLDEIFRVT